MLKVDVDTAPARTERLAELAHELSNYVGIATCLIEKAKYLERQTITAEELSSALELLVRARKALCVLMMEINWIPEPSSVEPHPARLQARHHAKPKSEHKKNRAPLAVQ